MTSLAPAFLQQPAALINPNEINEIVLDQVNGTQESAFQQVLLNSQPPNLSQQLSSVVHDFLQLRQLMDTMTRQYKGAGVGFREGMKVHQMNTRGALEYGGTSVVAASNPVTGGLQAATSLYSLISNWGDSNPSAGAANGAVTGAYIGSYILPGVGTAIGALLGGVAGGLVGSIKGGKHIDQQYRDAMRRDIVELGMFDENYEMQLANGDRYYFGFDGRHKFLGTDGEKRAPYQVDFAHPFASEAIGWVQPLAAALTRGNQKLRTDLTGYFVNAVLSNATTLAEVGENAKALYVQSNVPLENVMKEITIQGYQQRISGEDTRAFYWGIQSLRQGVDSKGETVTEDERTVDLIEHDALNRE